MNRSIAELSVLVLAATGCAIPGMAQNAMPGGYRETSVTNSRVVAAADFAVKAEEKALQKDPQTQAATLTLLSIVDAGQQIVSGTNYRLTLKVKMDDVEKKAEVVVYVKLSGERQLTSWKWK